MSSKTYSPAYDKAVATVFAIPLIGADTLLNAEHIASVEGWASTLIFGTIAATLSAAAALPIAERAWQRGSTGKAAALMLFFAVMLAFSFTTSVGRVGGHADGEAAKARSHNGKLAVAQQAYADARETMKAECASGRGSKCIGAENALAKARVDLTIQPAAVAENSMVKRISQATGISVEAVALYQPLLLPLALQLGGFAFLAYGLAPAAKREEVVTIDIEPVEVKTVETRKPKRTAPKALEYQPLFTKIDGRKMRKVKRQVANDDADFVPETAGS